MLFQLIQVVEELNTENVMGGTGKVDQVLPSDVAANAL